MNGCLILYLVIILCLNGVLPSNRWPNHDISTLKLLQIVHRHGDRTPIIFPPNDPFKNESYWPEGIAQLTSKGKYRMYKLGQFIRQEYHQYLGDNYSPREVYARSSLHDRCIESLSLLLSGAYPPNQKLWQWNNRSDAELGRFWQPVPIQTYMPAVNDLVLEQVIMSINLVIIFVHCYFNEIRTNPVLQYTKKGIGYITEHYFINSMKKTAGYLLI